MTKRPRPWGDNEDHSRLRKSHLSQKDVEKKSESAMASVYAKTLGKLFQGSAKLKKSSTQSEAQCQSCVSLTSKIAHPCKSCKNFVCSKCQESCENCSAQVCGQCSLQSLVNYSNRRCLYSWKKNWQEKSPTQIDERKSILLNPILFLYCQKSSNELSFY